MRQKALTIIAVFLFMPMWIFGQDYNALWKKVHDAAEKDLPQTAITHLTTIEQKAQKEKVYGQLLKAALYRASMQAEVSPDSLAPAVERLCQLESQAKDKALKAVYATVLYSIYSDNHAIAEDWQKRCEDYRATALANPEVLAKVKNNIYEPFVKYGSDSDIYDNDLLHVIGRELGAWEWMHDYYEKAGNRRAACMTALAVLRKGKGDDFERLAESKYIQSLDSLITQYADLPEAGEVAMERYSYMSRSTNATAAEKKAYLDMAIDRWGKWKRISQLRNSRNQLIASCFSAEIPLYVQMPQREQTIKLTSLCHLSSLTMKVYRTTLKGDHDKSVNYKKDLEEVMKSAVEVKDAFRQCTFPVHEDYDLFSDSLTLAGLPEGVYLLEFSTKPSTEVCRVFYYVTNLRVLSVSRQKSDVRYIVVDATTGQPVAGAKVMISTSRYDNKKEPIVLTTNKAGETNHRFTDGSWHKVFVYTDKDQACPSINGGDNFYFSDDKGRKEYTRIYTDRAIYRPGQTVHVAAIIHSRENYIETGVVADKTVTAQLRDANYKVIAEQELTTDRFGKCATSFTLPTGLKNGYFTVRINDGSESFRVEEYKRPTFELSFSEYKESYQEGDTVTIQGKALSYAGVPVQEAKVQYTVRRRIAYWWLSYSWYWGAGWFGRQNDADEIYKGETTTNEDGTFDVKMPMILPDYDSESPMFYTFEVVADVTDQAGETHSGSKSLPLGTKPTALSCDVSQRIRIDEIQPITFYRRNAAGSEIAGTVRYRLDGGAWKECAANAKQSILHAKLPSGEHRLEAVCEGDSIDMKFILFSLDDKKPAIETKDWFYVSDDAFPADGKPVTVQVGSSDPDLYIAYEVISGTKVLEEGFIRESKSLWNKKFTYKEEYTNGLLLCFAWVKDGVSYQHAQTIRRPLPDKSLTLKWETFRDRLKPGQQEEWRLSIKDKDGKPADAQLMAVLYDKSLDQLVHHYWGLYPHMSIPHASTSWTTMRFGSTSTHGSQRVNSEKVPDFSYSQFDHSVYPGVYVIGYGRRMMLGSVSMRAKGAGFVEEEAMVMAEPMMANAAMDVVGNDEDAGEILKAKEVVEDQKATANAAEEKLEESVQLRENMQETAFFYPALEADKKGDVVLKFTLPESLTTWRFMSVAHTTDLQVGTLFGETVAQKDVMLQPNMPRFIRMGDKAQLSARIFNISEQSQKGTAQIELIDPETEKVVYSSQQPVAVEAGKTGHVTFDYQPTDQYPLLICRMSVKGDSFSDGEQHYLPILPDKERVTKSVPFTQHEPGVKTIDLTKLIPAGTAQQKLTIEYTNNPAWLMVQSLAILGQPCETSAIDQAASYYSNMLAKTILQQTPKAKTIFEQWKRETGNETSLHSNLEKNQELKDIILQETPWVNDADRETEQKHRLADFFDENLINDRLATALAKLEKLQQGNGGFSWYPEMPASTYITMGIAEMLARLNVMTNTYGTATSIQNKAMRYMDGEIIELVKEMRKWEKKGVKPSFPSFVALRWLYVNAITQRELGEKAADAKTYLMPLLKKDIKAQSIYEKAMTTVILQQYGDTKTAREYVQSLKEYTVFTEEMGRYYDTRRAGYSWYSYKIPTEVAAIEAIKYVTPEDEQTIDEMRRWLLQEKKTQMWDTPISSVNAIYAFLFDHANLLATQEPTVFAIDQQPLELPEATAGIGYVKTAIQEPKGREFTATKTSTGTSWGAVYAQFMQKTSEVENAESGIKVKREILVGNSPLSTLNAPLKVGDRIKVRITIEVSRDLDFVQVLDRRAACMEPVRQLSGYRNGAYCSPKDFSTNYYYCGLAKGKHVLETEYYIDRAGTYETGTCTVQCAYSPEYRATAKSETLEVKE
ncbi:MAG: alpha-2-macroglobulin [Prevotella sp.]|nr:alpha-2-macroglobulin [Prevotella sp.]